MMTTDQSQASHTPSDPREYESPYELNRVRILRSLLPSGHGRSAVDIGCGPGLFSRELSIKGWRTASIDTDRENIERAEDYVDETHLGDALGILSQLRESQYDLALCLELIEHMPRKRGEDLLVGILRVLKPGGSLILSTPNRFSPEGLGGYYWGEKIGGWGKWDAWDSTHIHIYSSLEIFSPLKIRRLAYPQTCSVPLAK